MEQIKKFKYIIGGKNAVWYSVSKYLPWVSLRLCSGQGTAALWEQLTRPSIPFLHLCPHVPSNSWPRMFAHAISSEKNTLYLQASVLLSFSATQVLCSSPQLKAFLSHWIKPQASPLSSAKPSLFLNLICSSTNMCYRLADYVFLFLYCSSLPTQWRRKWQPTPVFLPGEYHPQGSLAGYSP